MDGWKPVAAVMTEAVKSEKEQYVPFEVKYVFIVPSKEQLGKREKWSEVACVGY